MALRNIALPERLRPWRNAGVTALLLPEPLYPSGRPAPGFLYPEEHQAPGRAPDAMGTRHNAHVPPPSQDTERIPPAAERQQAPSPDAWPPAWRQAFAKTRRAPLVWSYHELGQDLAGQGNPGRGDFFRSLLGDLRLPAGSSAFWPTAVLVTEDGKPGGTALVPNSAVYQAGLQRIAPRAVLFLGELGFIDAGIHPLPLFQQRIDQGRIVLHIPSLESLMENDGQKQITISFIQSALAFLL